MTKNILSWHLRGEAASFRQPSAIIGTRSGTSRWLEILHEGESITLFLDEPMLSQLIDATAELSGEAGTCREPFHGAH